MTINNRIKRLRESLSLTQSGFAELIKSSKSYISEIENGRSPSFNFIQSLLVNTEVEPKWLFTGEGTMYRQPAVRLPPTVAEIDKNLEGLTDEQRQEILSRTGEMLLLNTIRKEVAELKAAIGKYKED